MLAREFVRGRESEKTRVHDRERECGCEGLCVRVSEITSVCMHDRESVCVREYAWVCVCVRERERSEKD